MDTHLDDIMKPCLQNLSEGQEESKSIAPAEDLRLVPNSHARWFLTGYHSTPGDLTPLASLNTCTYVCRHTHTHIET